MVEGEIMVVRTILHYGRRQEESTGKKQLKQLLCVGPS